MLFEAPLTVLCTPATAKRLVTPADLLQEDLLRSYRAEEWENWFAAAGLQAVRVNGAIFDSSRLMIESAIHSGGVALAPAKMFTGNSLPRSWCALCYRNQHGQLLVNPFKIEGNDPGDGNI